MAKESTITGHFREVVKRHGDLTALGTSAGHLTYSEFNNRSNCLAEAVMEGNPRQCDPVAILLDDEAAHLTAVQGILKAGRVYLSLDPSFPLSRLQLMLKDAGVSLMITNRHHSTPVDRLVGDSITPIFVEGIDFSKIQSEPGLSISPDEIASIFYTSGSTGEPKGVMQNHRNVLHNVRDVTASYNLTCSDRIALLISTGFAASQTAIFGAFLNRATLCPYSFCSF